MTNANSTRAPLNQYRVVIWRGAERHLTVDGDFDDFELAKARADALYGGPEIHNASVFSCSSRCLYSAHHRGKPDFIRPFPATRLAGQDDPLKRGGTYRRK